ncbi:MAG TPA: hypothetical protein VL992_10475 [Tepidisphaeraceae bacterium]|nr:hypothetical protein [Tepidisphaeraceae bacterium]
MVRPLTNMAILLACTQIASCTSNNLILPPVSVLSARTVLVATVNATTGESGDVFDYYQATFTPLPDISQIVQVQFIIDTGGLHYLPGDCARDHRDCPDFATLFGAAEQQLIGAQTGERFVTRSSAVDQGETFTFAPTSSRWNQVKEALMAGSARFAIHTNIAEHSPQMYTARLYLYLTR